MSSAGAELHGFAYGEHLDALSERSLGYRLLAPAEPLPWCAEVEALARHLQNAPYPDHWPATELFCSVVLATGQRLIAVARYGLVDHTPDRRRGGLELVGAVGPVGLDAVQARAVYQWLKKRRAETGDLHALGGPIALADVLATAAPAPPAPPDPTPVLPVRVWQAGALLFAATTPSDPDHRLNLLEQGAGGNWQWLPLVGADFPVPVYAQRGPLVAWTPHLAGVALKLDHKPAAVPVPAGRPARPLVGGVGLLILLVLAALVGLNLWTTLSLSRHLAAASKGEAGGEVQPRPGATAHGKPPPAVVGTDDSRDRFARALYEVLQERGGRRELTQSRAELLAQYERLAQEHKDLQLADSDTEGKAAVGAVDVLAGRSADRVEEMVRKALTDKGFHPTLVKTACEFVHEQLSAELKEGR
jgi:hypothetical protein